MNAATKTPPDTNRQSRIGVRKCSGSNQRSPADWVEAAYKSGCLDELGTYALHSPHSKALDDRGGQCTPRKQTQWPDWRQQQWRQQQRRREEQPPL
jgi:hypothetical protein